MASKKYTNDMLAPQRIGFERKAWLEREAKRKEVSQRVLINELIDKERKR